MSNNGTNPETMFDLEAEQSLIGSILINASSMKMIDILPDEFFIHKHRWVWEALQKLDRAGKAIDFVTVCALLNKNDQLDQIGGPAYLTGLLNIVPSSLNFESYAAIIRDLSNRRQLIELAGRIAKQAYDTKTEIDLSVIASSLVQSIRHEKGASLIGGYAEQFYEEIIDRMGNPDSGYAISTGFMDFDKMTGGGIYPSQGLLIAAPPKIGKSMFCMQMGEQIASKQDLPGAIYSMEMNSRYFLARRSSAIGKVDFHRILSGQMNSEELTNFEKALDAIRDLPIYLSDASTWSLNALRSDLTRLKVEKDIKWVVIDYLGLLKNFGYKNKWDEDDYKGKELVRIFKDLDLAGVVIHTMLKQGQNLATPKLTDLRGSDVGYDFDTIMFMVADEKQENVVHFYPEASRHHPANGHIEMIRSPFYPMFADAAPAEVEIPKLDFEPQLPYKDN